MFRCVRKTSLTCSSTRLVSWFAILIYKCTYRCFSVPVSHFSSLHKTHTSNTTKKLYSELPVLFVCFPTFMHSSWEFCFASSKSFRNNLQRNCFLLLLNKQNFPKNRRISENKTKFLFFLFFKFLSCDKLHLFKFWKLANYYD